MAAGEPHGITPYGTEAMRPPSREGLRDRRAGHGRNGDTGRPGDGMDRPEGRLGLPGTPVAPTRGHGPVRSEAARRPAAGRPLPRVRSSSRRTRAGSDADDRPRHVGVREPDDGAADRARAYRARDASGTAARCSRRCRAARSPADVVPPVFYDPELDMTGEPRDLAQVDLRAEERVLPFEAPAANTTVTWGMRDVLWLGPDEWLVMGEAGTESSTVEGRARDRRPSPLGGRRQRQQDRVRSHRSSSRPSPPHAGSTSTRSGGGRHVCPDAVRPGAGDPPPAGRARRASSSGPRSPATSRRSWRLRTSRAPTESSMPRHRLGHLVELEDVESTDVIGRIGQRRSERAQQPVGRVRAMQQMEELAVLPKVPERASDADPRSDAREPAGLDRARDPHDHGQRPTRGADPPDPRRDRVAVERHLRRDRRRELLLVEQRRREPLVGDRRVTLGYPATPTAVNGFPSSAIARSSATPSCSSPRSFASPPITNDERTPIARHRSSTSARCARSRNMCAARWGVASCPSRVSVSHRSIVASIPWLGDAVTVVAEPAGNASARSIASRSGSTRTAVTAGPRRARSAPHPPRRSQRDGLGGCPCASIVPPCLPP